MSFELLTRSYEEGDEQAINELYYSVTGRARSRQEFEWQWLDAPGGRGEIWQIEATTATSPPELVGHHGVMPVRFTNGNTDLLFGKTENTMVRPDWRRKFLYPKFERRFAETYEHRFDALFSTIGPAEAIRLRKAIGYSFPANWVRCEIATGWAGEVRYALDKAVSRGNRWLGRAGADSASYSSSAGSEYADGRGFRALTDAQARDDAFFEAFWSRFRSGYGITPRRDREDLDWRFWSNPYTSNTTLVADTDPDTPGYVILRMKAPRSPVATIDDLVPHAPEPEHFYALLNKALAWLRDNGIAWVRFATTDDSCRSGRIAMRLQDRAVAVKRRKSIPKSPMARKVTSTGTSKGIDVEPWFVTGLVFEGRT